MSRTVTSAAIRDLSTGELAVFHGVAELLLGGKSGSANDLAELLNTTAKDSLLLAGFVPIGISGRQVREDLGKIEDKKVQQPLFERNDKGYLTGLTDCGVELNELAKRILVAITRCNSRSEELRIAASEAVSTYVFPDVMRDFLDRPENFPRISTGLFRSSMVRKGGAIGRGEIDLAVAWDVYTPDHSADVTRRKIESSRTTPCIIYHPHHAFGQWVRDARKRGGNFEARVLPEAFRHNILYPGALRTLVDSFDRNLAEDKCIPVESFPAVVTHAAMRVGIGLFPGWPRLLQKIRREAALSHIALPPDTTPMTLACFQRRNTTNPRADQFIAAMEQKISQLNSMASEQTAWQLVNPPAAFADRVGRSFPAVWDAYYINTGDEEPLYPHWRRGKWMLKLPDRPPGALPSQIKGSFEMPRVQDRGLAVYELVAEVGSDYLRAMSTRVDDSVPKEKRRPAFLCFQEMYTRREGGPNSRGERLLLLGFITHSIPGRPTVSPFVLCSPDTALGAEDFRWIEGRVECHPQAILDEVLTAK